MTNKTFEDLLEESVKIHGHLCPGQVLGVRLAMLGLKLSGISDPKGSGRKNCPLVGHFNWPFALLLNGFFISLKFERLHYCRFESRNAAKPGVFDYITFYNAFRKHSPINYMNPMDFERQHMAKAA